jgi:hypothetical protein
VKKKLHRKQKKQKVLAICCIKTAKPTSGGFGEISKQLFNYYNTLLALCAVARVSLF